MSGLVSVFYKIIYKFSTAKLKRKLSLLKHGWSLMVSPDSWLVQTGYVNSFLMKSAVDNHGMPLPWMNYNIIDFLNQRLTKDLKIFEYGSGNSTLYFSKFVDSITSVEYDADWYKLLNSKIDKLKITNVQCVYCDLDSNYSDFILSQSKFYDLVIVDGRFRVKCAINALKKLTNRGVILLDDSNRKKYEYVFEYYKRSGFNYLTFSGLKPTGFGNESSTIFYRKEQNCFNL